MAPPFWEHLVSWGVLICKMVLSLPSCKVHLYIRRWVRVLSSVSYFVLTRDILNVVSGSIAVGLGLHGGITKKSPAWNYTMQNKSNKKHVGTTSVLIACFFITRATHRTDLHWFNQEPSNEVSYFSVIENKVIVEVIPCRTYHITNCIYVC